MNEFFKSFSEKRRTYTLFAVILICAMGVGAGLTSLFVTSSYTRALESEKKSHSDLMAAAEVRYDKALVAKDNAHNKEISEKNKLLDDRAGSINNLVTMLGDNLAEDAATIAELTKKVEAASKRSSSAAATATRAAKRASQMPKVIAPKAQAEKPRQYKPICTSGKDVFGDPCK